MNTIPRSHEQKQTTDSGSQRAATSTGIQLTPTTRGTDSQLDRIERKLDQLIGVLAEEDPEPEEEFEVATLDGEHHRLPCGSGHL